MIRFVSNIRYTEGAIAFMMNESSDPRETSTYLKGPGSSTIPTRYLHFVAAHLRFHIYYEGGLSLTLASLARPS